MLVLGVGLGFVFSVHLGLGLGFGLGPVPDLIRLLAQITLGKTSLVDAPHCIMPS